MWNFIELNSLWLRALNFYRKWKHVNWNFLFSKFSSKFFGYENIIINQKSSHSKPFLQKNPAEKFIKKINLPVSGSNEINLISPPSSITVGLILVSKSSLIIATTSSLFGFKRLSTKYSQKYFIKSMWLTPLYMPITWPCVSVDIHRHRQIRDKVDPIRLNKI